MQSAWMPTSIRVLGISIGGTAAWNLLHSPTQIVLEGVVIISASETRAHLLDCLLACAGARLHRIAPRDGFSASVIAVNGRLDPLFLGHDPVRSCGVQRLSYPYAGHRVWKLAYKDESVQRLLLGDTAVEKASFGDPLVDAAALGDTAVDRASPAGSKPFGGLEAVTPLRCIGWC